MAIDTHCGIDIACCASVLLIGRGGETISCHVEYIHVRDVLCCTVLHRAAMISIVHRVHEVDRMYH